MSIIEYIAIGYLVLINIVSLVIYAKEGMEPTSRISALVLIILPIAGGSFGAAIANYFCDTEYGELRAFLHKFIAFLPPIMFIIQFILIVSYIGVDNCFAFWGDRVYVRAGWIGSLLVIINLLSFVLVIIRKSAYYIAPHGNFLIPDIILIPILILGGATGGVIAKVLFNFKEDWSCNAMMEVQNFLYNAGMFITSAIHIGLFVYVFYIR